MLAGGCGLEPGTGKNVFLSSKIKSGYGIQHSQILDVGLSEVTEEMLLNGGDYRSLLLVPKLRICGALPPLLH
jgi:hypothetical protein